MAAPMVKTRHPGIYRRGSRYAVVYRVNGMQRKESARTLDEALRLKRSREADRDRGEFRELSRTPLRKYAAEWVESYQGNGRRGFTENTREDYRRDLQRYAYPYLGDRALAAITPGDVARWIGWLADERAQGRRLADATVRRIVAPLRSCLATAKRHDLIRHNPADGAVLPHRPRVEGEGEEVRALTREQLDAFLRVVHPRHRLMFRFLAATGLRWSELIELRWSDLRLDGSAPAAMVRRARVRGRVKPPKSRHGRRDVPLDAAVVSELRQRRGDADALVFPSLAGTPLDHSTVRRRALRPAAEEAWAPWAGFHTFRHTCASLLFARGRNAKQVQRWLGHHSPSFTLDTYAHLLDDGIGEALDLKAELGAARLLPAGSDSFERQSHAPQRGADLLR